MSLSAGVQVEAWACQPSSIDNSTVLAVVLQWGSEDDLMLAALGGLGEVYEEEEWDAEGFEDDEES